jgi:outer membrane protein assembly factor BamD (BamD/ComL family)
VGTKRRGKRQYLYRSVAGLILCSMVACTPINRLLTQDEACDHLQRVERSLKSGDFDTAMKESQETLSRSPKSPPGDAALMNLGLICIHYANPKKDYHKALGYFTRLEKEFPRSALVEEAKIWVGVLQAFEKAKQVDIEIEGKKKGLGK